MDSLIYLRGLGVGFALAAPVGPVGVLCIRRALADGRYAAFIAGLGAAVADTFYGAVAASGLTVVSSFLLGHTVALRLLGSLFLLVLGVKTWRRPPFVEAQSAHGPGLIRDFLSTFLITLTNPATILAAMGVFAAVGATNMDDPDAAGTMIFGVFSGSTLWWLVLSAAAAAVRSRFSPVWLVRLNRVSGLILVLFGIGILLSCAFIPAP